MDNEKFNDLDLPPVQMTDAEIAQELYRYLVLVLDAERPKQPPPIPPGPN